MDFLLFLSNIPIIALVLFALGIVLLICEMFIPGFGVAGSLALLSFTLAIIFAADTFMEGLILTGIVLAIIALAIITFLTLLSRGKFSGKFILKDKNSNAQGFSSAVDLTYLVGSEGLAQTTLRPAGRIRIGEEVFDAISSGDYISTGDRIKVIEVNGNRIVVSVISPAVL